MIKGDWLLLTHALTCPDLFYVDMRCPVVIKVIYSFAKIAMFLIINSWQSEISMETQGILNSGLTPSPCAILEDQHVD